MGSSSSRRSGAENNVAASATRIQSYDNQVRGAIRRIQSDFPWACSAEALWPEIKRALPVSLELMRAAGVRPHLASQTIGARAATAAEARRLDERRGAPLLTMRRTSYDALGRALELGDHVYRASVYSFEIVLSAR